MILLQKVRQYCVHLVMAVLISVFVSLGFGTTDSFALNAVSQFVGQPQTRLATLNQAKTLKQDVEDKAHELMGNITGDPHMKASSQAKRLQSKTFEGMDNSIANPNYQPGGKTPKNEEEELAADEDMKTEARSAFK